MARYQAGDFVAATALIECFGPQLHRFFLSQCSSRADADDLLQETWLRIHRVRHTYRPGEPVIPWFYAIARCVRIDHYRKASRHNGARAQIGGDCLRDRDVRRATMAKMPTIWRRCWRHSQKASVRSFR